MTKAQLRDIPLFKLESSEVLFEAARFKTIAVSPLDEKTFYALNTGTGELLAQNQETKFSKKTPILAQDAEMLAINSQKKFI